MTDITCCVTGHRSQGLPWGFNECDPRREILRREMAQQVQQLYALGYRRFITGMALGVDMLFAETVLETLGGSVLLLAAVPFEGQADRWPYAQQERYHALLARCGEKKVFAPQHLDGCIRARNFWMVDASSLVLAIWNGRKFGGTYQTLCYARKQGRRVIVLPIPSV